MILVTGASGFVGRSLTQVLSRDGRQWRAFAGRMNDPHDLLAELPEVTTVIHLAGAENRGRKRMLRVVDVDGTERLVAESRRQSVERIIYVSRLGADPESLYPLLRAKGRAERTVRQSTIPYTIIRSATLFGRGDSFLSLIASLAAWSWPLVWIPGHGRAAMQPLWVEDLVGAVVECLDRETFLNRTVELAGEERLRYEEIVRLVLTATKMQRISFSPSITLVRPLARLLFGWWPKPPVTRFFLDRLSVPEVVPLDSFLRHFDRRPSRMARHISYLRLPGLYRRPFRA